MRAPILFTAAPERGQALAENWRGIRPPFVCVLAHTDTCLVPGLSAAGVSEQVRPFTPAADAEVVLLGEAVCLPRLPSHPRGAPGPAGITRAALRFASMDAEFIGAGLQHWPAAACARASTRPGANITYGRGVEDAQELFAAGRRVQRAAPYLVIGESVPGGTTTALALLLALGYDAVGRVSGSVPGNAHALKSAVACEALRAAGLEPGDGRGDPIGAVAAVGDPMQPLVAGMVLAAHCDVLLAGGSQMLAVAALVRALGGDDALEHVAIGTTRWVVQDVAADIEGLAGDISPHLPVLAANLDLGRSRHPGLQEYERGLVKEGVGAGGAAVAALLTTGESVDALEAQIDLVYDSLVGRLT